MSRDSLSIDRNARRTGKLICAAHSHSGRCWPHSWSQWDSSFSTAGAISAAVGLVWWGARW